MTSNGRSATPARLAAEGSSVVAADDAWRRAKARLIELETGAAPSWAPIDVAAATDPTDATDLMDATEPTDPSDASD